MNRDEAPTTSTMNAPNNSGVAANEIGTVIQHNYVLQAKLAEYYWQIAEDCKYSTSNKVNPTDSQQPSYALAEQMHVRPDVLIYEKGELVGKSGEVARAELRRTPFDECLTSEDKQFRRIVLVASSGMGKTTAVNMQVLTLARKNGTPWMVLRLPALLLDGIDESELVATALRADVLRVLECSPENAGIIARKVIEKLDANAGVILFDALDEVPEARRQSVLRAVRQFIALRNFAQAKHRIVLTSRPYAYTNELAKDEFSRIELARFTPVQLDDFVDRYFVHVDKFPAVGTALKAQLAQDRNSDRQTGVAHLLEEPMLANYACMLAGESAGAMDEGAASASLSPLPNTRYKLFDGLVRLMLEKWDPRRDLAEVSSFKQLFVANDGRSAMRAVLERAALWQATQPKRATAGGDAAEEAILPATKLREFTEAVMQSATVADITAVVNWIEQRSGLLSRVNDADGARCVMHAQLKYFLAVGELRHTCADDSEFAEKLLEHLLRDPDWFRQMTTMGLARIADRQRALAHAVRKIVEDSFERDNGTPLDAPHWKALAVFVIAWVDAVPASTWHAASGSALNKALQPLRGRILELVETQQLTVPLRAEAADAVGVLGDPRFEASRLFLWRLNRQADAANEAIHGFVRVRTPSGKFRMGHEKESDNKPRDVQIAHDFFIARTLTTVAQYACFVDAGGYKLGVQVWGAQGVAWRQGKFDSQVENEDYKKWLARRTGALRLQPWDWTSQLAHASRPVTGVTWFEARAYARWLDTQLTSAQRALLGPKRWEVRLPTENQWERAARASSLTASHSERWPWGDDEKIATQRANISGSGIGHASSVGVFAANAIGLHDMAGNAWQWMDNLYKNSPDVKFPAVERDYQLKTHTDLDKCDLLALRGGSWINNPEYASCSYRGGDLPGNWNYNIGLRVVLSLAKSEA